MRLDKFVCKSTKLSKQQAQASIEAGLVKINDNTVFDIKAQVHQNNKVTLDQVPLILRPFRYIMLHKPANTICSNHDEAYPSIFNFLNIEHKEELHCVGRLDVDTTGLVLITDDGHWSFNITRPEKQCEKTYLVGVSQTLKSSLVAEFKAGLQLQGESELTLPAKLTLLDEKNATLAITQGKFHQVKRMFASVGNRVVSLHRQSIATLTLDIPEGQWRYLSDAEIASLIPSLKEKRESA